MEAISFHRHQSWLNVPIAAELVPADLDVDAQDQVRPVCRLAGCLHPLAPEPLQREASEHRGLARSGRGATGHITIAGSVPEMADHVHTAALELRRLRILVLVDHVLVGCLRHQAGSVRRHPGRHERSQVQTGAPVEQQLIRHQVVSHLGPRALLGDLVAWQATKLLLLDHRGGARWLALAGLYLARLNRGAHLRSSSREQGTACRTDGPSKSSIEQWRAPVSRAGAHTR